MGSATRVEAPPEGSVTFRDGIGERRQIGGADPREMLCLRAELCAVPAFEVTLRERLTRLAPFRHAYYAQVHEVERQADPDAPLALLSAPTQGIRLAELFSSAASRGLNLDINAALCLIRQLVPAVAKLHEFGHDAAHGALGPERVVVTRNARLVITEYVLGSALEQLHYSQDRYWKDLRVALPRSAGLPRFDQRSDVTQIGVIALSLILGRLLREDEYPSKVSDVVASAWAVSSRGGFEPLAPGLRSWLGRTLQLDARNAFANAIQANEALDQVLSDSEYLGSPASLEAFLARYAAAEALEQFNAESAHGAENDAAPDVPVDASPLREFPQELLIPTPASESVVGSGTEVAAALVRDDAVLEAIQAPDSVVPEALEPAATLPPEAAVSAADVSGASDASATTVYPDLFGQPDPPPRTWPRWAFAAAAGIALLAVGVPLVRGRASAAAPPATGTLRLATNPAGASVVVDGLARGATPISLSLPAGPHSVELRGAGEPKLLSLTVTAGVETANYVELPVSAASIGQLQVRTEPAGATVTVDGAARGVTPVTVTDLPVGEHQVAVQFQGRSVQQPVTIESNTVFSLFVPLSPVAGSTNDPARPAVAPAADAPPVAPSGWVTVFSPIDLQVREAGRLIGSAPGDRIPLPVGAHELELVNDGAGYREIRTVQVAAGRAATVKVDLPTGSLSVNASPWAEVWVDGTRVGETPIGNLPTPIGAHEVLLKHPELGEQLHRVTVTATGVTRLSTDLQKR